MPLTAVFSGPRATRDKALGVLESVGFTIEHRLGEHNRGHPSYRNHIDAHVAGKPNSGHTPGLPHPETGAPFEPDPRISFVTVFTIAEDGLHTAMLGDASLRLEPFGWINRSSYPQLDNVLTQQEVEAIRGIAARLGQGA